MNYEEFRDLNPEYHRLIKQIIAGDATEVQINYVLKTNNLSREKLDESVEFFQKQFNSDFRIALLFIVAITFFVGNLLIWFLQYILN